MKVVLNACVLLLFTSGIIKAQTRQHNLLNRPVAPNNKEDIQSLIDFGYIKDADKATIGSYLVDASARGITLAHFTYGQLLDSLVALKQAFIREQVKKYNFGKDSVFIRTPLGEKFLLGLGQMSFEALLERAGHNLPKSYSGDSNLFFDSEKAIQAFAALQANDEFAWISGTVVLIERDKGTLSKLRIGDIEEIARRIRLSKEFAPFVNALK